MDCGCEAVLQLAIVQLSTTTCISIGVALVTLAVLYPLFFKHFDEFIDCLRYIYQPAIISMFRGETVEDFWGSLKIYVWLVLAFIMGAATHYKLPQFFPNLTPAEISRENRPIRQVSGKPYKPAPATLPATERAPTQEPVLAREVARTTAGNPVAVLVNTSNIPPKTVSLPVWAERYGVKVGDVVQIAALKPAIAFRQARILAIDDGQLTVQGGVDRYEVRWNDLTQLRRVEGK